MKSCRQKAVEILGHQEGCTLLEMDGPEGRYEVDPCRCYSDQLHVLIAAERGTLRKEHPDTHLWQNKCSSCGQAWITGQGFGGEDTPCAEPLTPALAWELEYLICEWATNRDYVVEWTRVLDFTRLPHYNWTILIPGADEGSALVGEDQTRLKAVARLYLALAEAGLLRRDDAD